MSEQFDKIKALFATRQQLVTEKAHEADLLLELEKSSIYVEWKAAQEKRSQVAAEEKKLYDDVTALATSAFAADKTNPKPFPGITIKAFTVYKIALEPDQIVNALIEHKATKLLQPIRGWEKTAIAIGIEGVVEDKEYRAQVASDLSSAVVCILDAERNEACNA